MKFAFSTVACPKWDFETIVERAKEYGYEGVEIRAFMNEPVLSAANVLETDAGQLKSLFSGHGVQISCLSSSITMTGEKKRDQALRGDWQRLIDTAVAVDCGMVKIFDCEVQSGSVLNPAGWGKHSRAASAIDLSDWLAPIGDYAAERGICIAIENALSFRRARDMWMILERINHPSICCCWDVTNAALAGEPPSVSVPTLNSKIAYVQVKDAKLSTSPTICKLGDGDVQLPNLLKRLQGIGYDGWIAFHWDKAWLSDLAEPEAVLPDAIKKLRDWTRPPEPEPKPTPAKKPAAAAPVAAPAAK